MRDLKTYSYYFDRFAIPLFDFKEKERCLRDYVIYMLARTQRMFRYTGLPDTIPQRMLEQQLQVNGFTCVTEVEGKLYCFWGGLGGEPDEYYRPTICVVANPGLKVNGVSFNKSLKIDEDCVIVRNDSYLYGLLPLFRRYGTAMVENDVSFRLASINSRIQSLISAPDDETAESALKYLEDIEAGNLGVIASNEFLDGIKAQSVQGSMRTFTDLIEYQQYLKASWYNEIGLNANYNMKREKLSTTESQMNSDALLPLVDDMLEQRRLGVERINQMYGTNISVEFESSWEKLLEEFESNQVDGEVNGDDSGTNSGNPREGNTAPSAGTDSGREDVSEENGGEDGQRTAENPVSEELREDDSDMDENSGDDGTEETPEGDDDSASDVSVSVEVHVEVNGDEERQEEPSGDVSEDTGDE